MARTKKSLFCADCKAKLAREVVRAMSEGYDFESMLRVFGLFHDKSRAYLEGYLFATWLLTVEFEDKLRTTDKGAFLIYPDLSKAEEAGISQGILDGMDVLQIEREKNDWDSHQLRHRLYELVIYYFGQIRYTFPGHDPRMTEKVVRHVWSFLFKRMNIPMPDEVSKSEEEEVDSICKAIESIAEKI